MNNNIKKFVEEYCKECKEPCEKGIVETIDQVKCIDRDISLNKLKSVDMFKLRRILMKLNISASLDGYNYILECVNILTNKNKNIKIVEMYEKIAKKYKTTKTAVERAIRYSIEKAFSTSEILQEIYTKKPNNSSFVCDLAFNIDVFEEQCFK